MMGQEQKPLLVFINPRSGTKIANKLFTKYLKPDLEGQHLTYEVVITEYAGHAKEMVQQRDLSRYSGVVTVSGDGLMFEVLNGLYSIGDWQRRLGETPIGLIPGGSGNALNCSLLRQMNQPLDGINNLGSKHSSRNVVTGLKHNRRTKLDFIEVETSDGQRVLSFLGVTIGLIADVDIGSEAVRFLGYMRSHFLVMTRILFPRVYRSKVSWLPLSLDADGKPVPVPPEDTPLHLPPLSDPVPEDWRREEGEYFLVYALNIPLLDPVTLLAPDARLDDGVIWLVMVRDSMPRKEMIQWFLNTKDAGHKGKTGVTITPVRAFRIEPVRPRGYLSIDAESFEFGPVQGQILPSKANLLTE